MIVSMKCPVCGQLVPIAEHLDVDTHGGQRPSGTFAQLAEHSRTVTDEDGRAWDVLCPQSSSASSKPMLHRT